MATVKDSLVGHSANTQVRNRTNRHRGTPSGQRFCPLRGHLGMLAGSVHRLIFVSYIPPVLSQPGKDALRPVRIAVVRSAVHVKARTSHTTALGMPLAPGNIWVRAIDSAYLPWTLTHPYKSLRSPRILVGHPLSPQFAPQIYSRGVVRVAKQAGRGSVARRQFQVRILLAIVDERADFARRSLQDLRAEACGRGDEDLRAHIARRSDENLRAEVPGWCLQNQWPQAARRGLQDLRTGGIAQHR